MAGRPPAPAVVVARKKGRRSARDGEAEGRAQLSVERRGGGYVATMPPPDHTQARADPPGPLLIG